MIETKVVIFDDNDLLSRRARLALMTDIPDMFWYAEEWNKLAADFTAIGFVHNAEMCTSNWNRYMQMAIKGASK